MDNILDADLEDVQLINKLYKGIHFYYVLLIFIANMHELFHERIKTEFQLLMPFRKL